MTGNLAEKRTDEPMRFVDPQKIEDAMTPAEKLLGIRFVSDPREARFPLPKPPKGHPEGVPYTINNFELTPEIAEDWLTYRVIREDRTPKELKHGEYTANRRIIPNYARQWQQNLSGTGTAGTWEAHTHQGVAFTTDGFLLDGQHRTSGVFLANKKIMIPATFGVSWGAYAKMDANRKRAAGQMVGDMPNATLASTTARLLLPVLHGVAHEEYSMRGHEDEIIDIVRHWPHFQNPEWLKAVRNVSAPKRDRHIPAAPLAAVVMGALAAEADPFEVQAFLNGLNPLYRDGYLTIGKKGEDPRLLLRRYFLANRKDDQGRYSGEDQRSNVAVCRRAMTLWLNRDIEGKREQIVRLQRPGVSRDLPPMWEEDRVREFHAEHVGS